MTSFMPGSWLASSCHRYWSTRSKIRSSSRATTSDIALTHGADHGQAWTVVWSTITALLMDFTVSVSPCSKQWGAFKHLTPRRKFFKRENRTLSPPSVVFDCTNLHTDLLLGHSNEIHSLEKVILLQRNWFYMIIIFMGFFPISLNIFVSKTFQIHHFWLPQDMHLTYSRYNAMK